MKTYTELFQGPLTNASTVAALREGRSTCWLRETISSASSLSASITLADLDRVVERFTRFAPVLAKLFVDNHWDGRVCSELLEYETDSKGYQHLVKADHALPMTGSIKARGGVYELLCYIEHIGVEYGLVTCHGPYEALCSDHARGILKNHCVVVASTGNLGFSIGLVARAFGIDAEIHMSHDAREWKKDRLRSLGATVIEHSCDYSETVACARASSQHRPHTHFVDDENSRTLLLGYSGAGRELAAQLKERDIAINPQRPLIVYLPCGVGGAPGGITLGLKAIYGRSVITVFVEPTASPCVLAALMSGAVNPPSVYELGLHNHTIADGLAVPRASKLVLEAVGQCIDAVVTVSDRQMVEWVRRTWKTASLRLEPSAAAAFAAVTVLRDADKSNSWPSLENAVNLSWTTGGSRLPDNEFKALLTDG